MTDVHTPDDVSRRLVVVSAGLGTPSSTRLLADRLVDATRGSLARHDISTRVEIVELRDHAMDVMGNLVNGFASPSLEAVMESLATADGAIMTTPLFTTSYSGLFKSFVDVIEPGVLTSLPVLIGATGGTERHSLALDHSIRPLFVYHRAIVATTGVYAATSDWGSADTGLPARIARAATELAELMRGSTRSHRVFDPFALSVDVDQAGSA